MMKAPPTSKRRRLVLVVASAGMALLFQCATGFSIQRQYRRTRVGLLLLPSSRCNIYDDWRSDAVVDTMHLCDENVERCLEEFMESDYGQQMFGCHDLPSSHGITGALSFVELAGPEVVLQLDGAFWHRRETVLGRAAVWLNARMPEIVRVTVADREQLQDWEEIVDEFTGEVLFTRDKRAPDFNGDRETMEYQGIDPDVRGPFPQGIGGLRPSGSMINPA